MATDVQDMELSEDEISALLATTRAKGQYNGYVRSFVESGQRGRKVSIESGQFAGKAQASVKTGLAKAVEAEGFKDQVRVIAPKGESFVALVNTSA